MLASIPDRQQQHPQQPIYLSDQQQLTNQAIQQQLNNSHSQHLRGLLIATDAGGCASTVIG